MLQVLHPACLICAVVSRKVIGRNRQDYATRPCGSLGIYCNWNFLYRCRGNLQICSFGGEVLSKGQEIIIISCKDALYFPPIRPSFCSFSGFQCYMMFSWKILPNFRWWKEHSFHKCKKATTFLETAANWKTIIPLRVERWLVGQKYPPLVVNYSVMNWRKVQNFKAKFISVLHKAGCCWKNK